jgi:uncharacterized protein YxeA
MTTSQPIGLVITLFLTILTAVLIWDEIRTERRFQSWVRQQDREKKPQE